MSTSELILLFIPGVGNALLFGWLNSELALSVGGDLMFLQLQSHVEPMVFLWLGWNKHCITWISGGYVKV